MRCYHIRASKLATTASLHDPLPPLPTSWLLDLTFALGFSANRSKTTKWVWDLLSWTVDSVKNAFQGFSPLLVLFLGYISFCLFIVNHSLHAALQWNTSCPVIISQSAFSLGTPCWKNTGYTEPCLWQSGAEGYVTWKGKEVLDISNTTFPVSWISGTFSGVFSSLKMWKLKDFSAWEHLTL